MLVRCHPPPPPPTFGLFLSLGTGYRRRNRGSEKIWANLSKFISFKYNRHQKMLCIYYRKGSFTYDNAIISFFLLSYINRSTEDLNWLSDFGRKSLKHTEVFVDSSLVDSFHGDGPGWQRVSLGAQGWKQTNFYIAFDQEQAGNNTPFSLTTVTTAL